MGRPIGMIYGCDGKQGFGSFIEAERAVKRIRKFSKKDGQMALYRCSYCPNWHLGSKPKGRRSK